MVRATQPAQSREQTRYLGLVSDGNEPFAPHLDISNSDLVYSSGPPQPPHSQDTTAAEESYTDLMGSHPEYNLFFCSQLSPSLLGSMPAGGLPYANNPPPNGGAGDTWSFEQEALLQRSMYGPPSITINTTFSPDPTPAQSQQYTPSYSPATPASAGNFSFQSTPQTMHHSPVAFNGMGNGALNHANSPAFVNDFQNVTPECWTDNNGFQPGLIPGFPHDMDPSSTKSSPSMHRTISGSRSATSDHSRVDAPSPISSASSPLPRNFQTCNSSPSNNSYDVLAQSYQDLGIPSGSMHHAFSNPQLKRGPSDPLEASQTGRRTKRQSGRTRACLACYLAHKTCLVPCDKCGHADSSFPECVSSTIRKKNIFLDCLNEADLTVARDMISRRDRNGYPPTKLFREFVRRDVDLKLMMEVLSDHKVGNSGAYASFFENHNMKNHQIFSPFYQVNIALQGRKLLATEPRVNFNESDLLILRAVCASRMLAFIENGMEKNKKQTSMLKGSQKARDLIVFLATSLEQVLFFSTTMDGPLAEPLIIQRNDLVYHLAYLLRHMAKATFANGNLFSDVHIGPDNDVFLKKEFWPHLNSLYLDALAKDLPVATGPEMPSIQVTDVGGSSSKPAPRAGKRTVGEEYNKARDHEDAKSLLGARLSTDENTVDDVAATLGETHISSPFPLVTEFHVGQQIGNTWHSGMPEASDGNVYDSLGLQVAAGRSSSPQGATMDLSRGSGSNDMGFFGQTALGVGGNSSFMGFGELDTNMPFGIPGNIGVECPITTANVSSIPSTSDFAEFSYFGQETRQARSISVGSAYGAAMDASVGSAEENLQQGGMRRRFTNGKAKVRQFLRL